jgi:hypothetical protein
VGKRLPPHLCFDDFNSPTSYTVTYEIERV